MQRRPDISLARALLGWEPTVPLEEGLDRTIADFAERLGRCAARATASRPVHPAHRTVAEGT